MGFINDINTAENKQAILDALQESRRVDGYVVTGDLFTNYCKALGVDVASREFSALLGVCLRDSLGDVEHKIYRTRRVDGKPCRTISLNVLVAWATGKRVELPEKAKVLEIICFKCKCKI